jgi:membrane protein involved in D-alanine export
LRATAIWLSGGPPIWPEHSGKLQYADSGENPQDFWRRFHISLSEWLRDVVFMPIYEPDEVQLFPSEQNAGAKYRYFCTLFCMGAWNGLERHYVISGALFGAISVVHNMLLWSAKRSRH